MLTVKRQNCEIISRIKIYLRMKEMIIRFNRRKWCLSVISTISFFSTVMANNIACRWRMFLYCVRRSLKKPMIGFLHLKLMNKRFVNADFSSSIFEYVKRWERQCIQSSRPYFVISWAASCWVLIYGRLIIESDRNASVQIW